MPIAYTCDVCGVTVTAPIATVMGNGFTFGLTTTIAAPGAVPAILCATHLASNLQVAIATLTAQDAPP